VVLPVHASALTRATCARCSDPPQPGGELCGVCSWMVDSPVLSPPRRVDLDSYRLFVRELKQSEFLVIDDLPHHGRCIQNLPKEMKMNAEVVSFEGYQFHFELTPHSARASHTVLRLVNRGEPEMTTMAPGTPAELAALLRERAGCPGDVFKIMNEMGQALLAQAA
jgi:hypothetical protein